MSANVARGLLQGAVAGLSAYIKPGGLHRVKPVKLFDEVLCNLLSQLEPLMESYSLGERIRSGELAASALELGRLFAKSMRESYRVCGSAHPQYTVPLVAFSLSLGHSGVESALENPAKFRKSMELFISIDKWSEVKHFMDSLRSVGRADMHEHLTSTGITQVSLIRAGASFNDVFKVLSSRWPGFSALDIKEALALDYLKKLMDYQQKYGGFNAAAVALYMELALPSVPSDLRPRFEQLLSQGAFASHEGMARLLELDALMRKRGVELLGPSEVVAVISALAGLEGIRY